MIPHNLEIYENDPYEKENLLSMESYALLIEQYSISKNSFLELGIGHSKTIDILVKKFKKLEVIEAESSLIKKYKHKYKEIKFINSYFEKYETAKLYDNIGMGFILEHVEDPELILKKFINNLSEDGKIFVSVPNANSLHRKIAKEAGLLDDIKKLSDIDKSYGHLRFLTYYDWVSLFEKCNLNLEASHGLYLKPFTTNQIHELNLDEIIYRSLCKTAYDLPEISNSCFFVLTKKASAS